MLTLPEENKVSFSSNWSNSLSVVYDGDPIIITCLQSRGQSPHQRDYVNVRIEKAEISNASCHENYFALIYTRKD